MIYDLTILHLLPNRLAAALPLLPSGYAACAPGGKALGCFCCEFGVLVRFAFLSAYEEVEALYLDRAVQARSGNLFGLGEHLRDVSRSAFRPLPFADPITEGDYGPFYEFRTYTIAHEGLPETVAAWTKVVPRRREISPMLTTMVAMEGTPAQFLHIWPYRSIDQRMKARAQASAEGIWPPPGGSLHFTNFRSELFIATEFSDLR